MVRERLRNVCHFDSCCVASKVRSEPKVLGAACSLDRPAGHLLFYCSLSLRAS